MQQVVRKAAPIAPMVPPPTVPMAPTMTATVVVVATAMAKAPQGLLAVKVCQKIVMVQFLELKPLDFLRGMLG